MFSIPLGELEFITAPSTSQLVVVVHKFKILRIQSENIETLVVSPGIPTRPQPSPFDTIPTTTPSTTKPLPLSP